MKVLFKAKDSSPAISLSTSRGTHVHTKTRAPCCETAGFGRVGSQPPKAQRDKLGMENTSGCEAARHMGKGTAEHNTKAAAAAAAQKPEASPKKKPDSTRAQATLPP